MRCLARLVVACGFVGGAAAAAAQQPVTLTSTADFQRGNNEGLVSPTQDRVTRAPIAAGTLGAWTAAAALPVGTDNAPAVAHNGFAYLIGGRDVDFSRISDVRVAPIAANGSLGPWTSATSLPTARGNHASVAYNNFVYAIGGLDFDYNVLADVLVAPLNANGSVGGWTSTTALPSGRYYHSSVAYNGFLYVIGGLDDSLTDVLVAPFHADGSLGDWSPVTSLPSQRAFHSCIAYNGFLYVIGGGTSPYDVVTEVLVAPLNADGSIGSWTATTALPAARGLHTSVAADGFVYAIGGLNGDTVYDEVLSAPINGDGSVGDWSATASLPSARGFHSSVAFNGYMYTFGGMDDTFTIIPDVVVAPISLDVGSNNQAPNRLCGYYSYLIDLQNDTSTRSIVLNGQAGPGGSVRLQVRLAPDSTKVFGAEAVYDSAPLGSAINIFGTARYVWIRLALDDTGTSNADQATYISDITISPFAPPSPGTVSDGLGADIDTQVSTTTIEAHWSGFTAGLGDSIASYEWAIGTAPGNTNIQAWVNVGTATNASNSSLSLSLGTKYVSVRAISASGLPSSIASSDGVQVEAASTGGGGGGGGGGKHCGQTAATSPGSVAGLFIGIVILAAAFGTRLKRRVIS
jgi:hypothetical protein